MALGWKYGDVKRGDVFDEAGNVHFLKTEKGWVLQGWESGPTIIARNARKKVVSFVTGHGEPSLTDSDRNGYSAAKQALENQNCTVQELVLPRQTQVPNDAAVVIVAGPRRDLLDSELEALSAFVGRGGHLFVMIDPETVPGLVTFVKRYGLEVGNDVVIETNPLGRQVGGDYLMPVVMAYGPHAITRELGNMMTMFPLVLDPSTGRLTARERNVMTMFPLVRSVEVAKDLPQGITAQGLAMTSAESWAETDLKALHEGRTAFEAESDRRGPISIAAVATIASRQVQPSGTQPTDAADQGKRGTVRPARLVVVGDAEFANNSYFSSLGNGNFFLSIVGSLAWEDD